MQAFINPQKKIITKTIWQLSLVSLFTDMAGEMLYPIMPLYLKSIGFSLFAIGVLEGIAEAVAGLTKSYFGSMSDAKGKRLPFIQIGYTLSALSRPMMALFTAPLWVFFSRTMERLGKGIRTGARDALLSDEATKETKGTVFGFHRSMDTIGAVIGPAIGLLFLYFYKDDYKTLFYIAFVPGLLAIACTLVIKEKPRPALIQYKGQQPGFFAFIHYWKKSSPEYKKLVTGLLAFALVNSSDVFLLLKMKENGLSTEYVVGIYIFYNLVFALMAYPLGIIADQLGLKKVFLFGLVLFVIVYTGFAVNHNMIIFIVLFFLYGLYAAATDSVSKAWISNIAPKSETATAIGTYMGFQSIATLVASSIAGLLWDQYGAVVAFMVTAVVTAGVVLYLSMMKFEMSKK
ncbi:MAG TPA: MFS transporter [Ferruginibacter sp.]|nr:MFS transporter [Ferruginibacter sp.]